MFAGYFFLEQLEKIVLSRLTIEDLLFDTHM